MALITLTSRQMLLPLRYACFRLHNVIIHSENMFLLTVKLPRRQSLGSRGSRRKDRHQEHIHSCHTCSGTQCHCNPSSALRFLAEIQMISCFFTLAVLVNSRQRHTQTREKKNCPISPTVFLSKYSICRNVSSRRNQHGEQCAHATLSLG